MAVIDYFLQLVIVCVACATTDMYVLVSIVVLLSELVWRVARCTSAAPFYFKPEGYYIDGGLLASNPSLHAVTTIQRHLSREGLGQTVSLVVSAGAGMNPPSKFHRLRINNALGRSVTFPLFMVNLVSVTVLVTDANLFYFTSLRLRVMLFSVMQAVSACVWSRVSCMLD